MIETSGVMFLGIALVSGFLIGKATRWVRLTAIIGYIIAGIILGPITGLVTLGSFESRLIVNLTLSFVAFIIGIGFTKNFILRTGSSVIKITIIESLITASLVTLGVYLVTRNLPIAIILGALGPATAPAGTVATLHECGARGRFSKIIVGIVGFDDAIAVLIFVIGLTAVRVIIGGDLSIVLITKTLFLEIGVAIALGIIFGIILAFIVKLLKNKVEMYIIAAAFIILCSGICEALGASLILACMVLGMTFVNLAPQEGKVIHNSIEQGIPVLFIIFFFTAGLELEPGLLLSVGLIGIAYIVSRTIGKYIGAYTGCTVAKTRPKTRRYLGFALFSQAGVAIGLALLVGHELGGLSRGEELGAIAITVITATTVIFEILGPIGVKFATSKVHRRPRTKEEKIIAKLSRTADEIDVFASGVDEDLCVYSECDDEEFVYTKNKRNTTIERYDNERYREGRLSEKMENEMEEEKERRG